ncbi:hypothetical protein BLNAU_15057 [Blattamonas nauphoetae]|uniref:RING-type E3 ubiquitin transferase n=1 Tax=Blattamonas nauphoetae TaxID=2049346 RepID=A0ABQ9XHA9_9EUKA|nr:hypothetical protein BLNAU_15057 [Blattamonas nauphoetae]
MTSEWERNRRRDEDWIAGMSSKPNPAQDQENKRLEAEYNRKVAESRKQYEEDKRKWEAEEKARVQQENKRLQEEHEKKQALRAQQAQASQQAVGGLKPVHPIPTKCRTAAEVLSKCSNDEERKDAVMFEVQSMHLMCPITFKFFQTPVLAEDGYFYEKNAIQAHLKTSKTSPTTRQPMGPSLALSEKMTRIVAEFRSTFGKYID